MPEQQVLLVVMPWANPEYPSLSLGLLQAILNREGIPCDTLYANLAFARYLDDWPLYRHMCYAAEGDIVFTPYYFGTEVEAAARTIQARTGRYSYAPLADLEHCRRLVQNATEFIEGLFAGVRWENYDVIGFSLMFQQLVGSLSLTRLIKARYPDKRIVFGGPSCDDCMGLEMLRSFPEVDYVVNGEADAIIAPLIREIRSQRDQAQPHFETPGVAYRSGSGAIVSTGRQPALTQLDSLPFPDYDPYFQQLEALGLPELEPVLYMEASRGCWWGQKSRCTFCGLNGLTLQYRGKSAERVIDEICYLSQRHRMVRFWTSDNILDYRSFAALLPKLAELRQAGGYDLSFFFEIKANLTREKVQAIRDAGITWVQPGIESFSDHILDGMRKGCTGIQQMHALKLLAEQGMDVDWNLIYRLPGEQPEDYLEMAELIPFIHHLPPPAPGAVVPMALQRFSPYQTDPSTYGITNVRPAGFYHAVFPDPKIDLDQLVYVFDYDHASHRSSELAAAHQIFFQAVQEWRQVYRPRTLVCRRGPDFVRIIDQRQAGLERIITLAGLQARIYLFCTDIRTAEAIARKFGQVVSQAALQGFLDQMVAQKLMYRSRAGQYLSLALQDGTGRSLQVRDAVADTLARGQGV